MKAKFGLDSDEWFYEFTLSRNKWSFQILIQLSLKIQFLYSNFQNIVYKIMLPHTCCTEECRGNWEVHVNVSKFTFVIVEFSF